MRPILTEKLAMTCCLAVSGGSWMTFSASVSTSELSFSQTSLARVSWVIPEALSPPTGRGKPHQPGCRGSYEIFGQNLCQQRQSPYPKCPGKAPKPRVRAVCVGSQAPCA